MYLYVTDPYEAKYHFLFEKGENVRIRHLNDPKAFIEYSNDIQDISRNINKYSLGEENKVLIDFDDIIADMISNKKLNRIVAELFITGRKLKISLVFITRSFFNVP